MKMDGSEKISWVQNILKLKSLSFVSVYKQTSLFIRFFVTFSFSWFTGSIFIDLFVFLSIGVPMLLYTMEVVDGRFKK
jgi:hypothetical protein